MQKLLSLFIFSLLLGCTPSIDEVAQTENNTAPYLVVLGTAQDAGFPQSACQKDCCRAVWENPDLREWVSCMAFVDPVTQKAWMFDATPDFKNQLHYLQKNLNSDLAGIFLTHAHMGHYTGLMHLGREAMGAQAMPVYAMPKMKGFLSGNGPWSQLVQLENISIQPLKNDSSQQITSSLRVTPLQVPHRDEYSETVGYSIQGPRKKALFIPDIDKWEKWSLDINTLIKDHDLVFLDGTFFANGEIPGRDMSEIPHPFVEESMAKFGALSQTDRAKVHFIHFNHTNPVLRAESEASRKVKAQGMHIARTGDQFPL
ncbi:MAG: pyrroloquinoline quinone biosynthesis protein PqqB [Saprospiraceae bacterium]